MGNNRQLLVRRLNRNRRTGTDRRWCVGQPESLAHAGGYHHHEDGGNYENEWPMHRSNSLDGRNTRNQQRNGNRESWAYRGYARSGTSLCLVTSVRTRFLFGSGSMLNQRSSVSDLLWWTRGLRSRVVPQTPAPKSRRLCSLCAKGSV